MTLPAVSLDLAPGKATIGLVEQVNNGLPLSAADDVSTVVAPGDRNFKYRLVPKATYARRLALGRSSEKVKRARTPSLSKEESERVVRLARIWAFAREVMKDDTLTRRFLTTPHMLLNARAPLDVTLEGELGGKLVEDILGRLAHGSAV